ncbi:MAG: M24 family metallopeptidase C-terminal domain-containing protein [bacterium]
MTPTTTSRPTPRCFLLRVVVFIICNNLVVSTNRYIRECYNSVRTGHGIGYILNVHEGPQRIGTSRSAKYLDPPILPGMVTSDEPGLYVEGKFGIRIETILLCVKDMENEFGKFLRFEPLTLAPIDRRALDPAYLASKDIERLNAYHEKVWESISPFLEGEELAWLYEATKEF